MTLLVSVLAMSVVGGGQAFAAWTNYDYRNVVDTITDPNTITGITDLKDLKETSGLVASKTWPGWYYTVSDRVKLGATQDSYTACSGFSGTQLENCQKTERAKLWMVHMASNDEAPNYRKIDQVKAFPISNASWAYDLDIAFNGDWEDLTQGPVRTVNGTSTNTILISATGKEGGLSSNDYCDTQRVIEFNELNPYSAPGTTWSPSYIFDLDGTVIDNDQSDCNIEAMWLDFDGTTPYAHFVTYGSTTLNGSPVFGTDSSNTVFKRVLTTTTGRAASTGFNNGVRINPTSTQFQRVGRLAVTPNTKRYQISGAGYQQSNDDMVMISSNSGTGSGCQLLMWHSRSYATTTYPNEYNNICGSGVGGVIAEGVSYVYSTDPSVKSIHVIYDETDNTKIYHRYFYWL